MFLSERSSFTVSVVLFTASFSCASCPSSLWFQTFQNGCLLSIVMKFRSPLYDASFAGYIPPVGTPAGKRSAPAQLGLGGQLTLALTILSAPESPPCLPY